jgi:hypothetical protein
MWLFVVPMRASSNALVARDAAVVLCTSRPPSLEIMSWLQVLKLCNMPSFQAPCCSLEDNLQPAAAEDSVKEKGT